MHVYIQQTGEWYLPDGTVLFRGYSGAQEGLNNPAAEGEASVGPIPAGDYTIGPAFDHPAAGPHVMRLEPIAGIDTHGRTGFLLHGDTATRDFSASHGCIIGPRSARDAVSASPDRHLRVVPTPP